MHKAEQAGTSAFPLIANQSKHVSVSFGRTMFSSLVGLLGIAALLVLSLANEYREADKHAQSEAETLSRVLEEHALAVVQKVDMILLDVQSHTRPADMRMSRKSGGPRAGELHALLKAHVDNMPEVSLLHLVNAHGEHIHSSLAVPPLVSLADRPYFLRQRNDAAAGLVISSPLVSRVTGNWTLILSRRINFEDGSFAGTVQASLDMKYFQQFYRSLNMDAHGLVALYDKDLRLAARYPLSEKDMGKISNNYAKTYIEKGVNHAVYHAKSVLDGVDRIYSFRQVGNLPLFVFAGIAEDDYLAEWRRHVWQYGIGLVIFSLIVLGQGKRQRQAEDALLKSEENLRIIADHTFDWEYWEGPQHELHYMSPSCERFTGYSLAEFTADSGLLYRIIHPDDQHLMRQHLENIAFHDEMVIDFRIVRRDGEIRWISHGCQAVYGKDGRHLGRRASNRDITERKQAEAEVRRLNAELEQRVAQRTAQLEAANKELEEFSYSMSHDMSTPLRALDGFSKILLDEHSAQLNDEGKRLLRVLRENSRRMGRLVNDILHFLSVGRLRMELGPIDIARLASEIFSELQQASPARGLRLEVGTLSPAWGDRNMIREVLQNLLSNAVKFSPLKGEVLVELGCTTGETENIYSVRDHGIGFDMLYADKLFRVFERVHPTGQYEGSGIGLALVKRIITRHGGRVWAEGKVNEGATLYFALPTN